MNAGQIQTGFWQSHPLVFLTIDQMEGYVTAEEMQPLHCSKCDAYAHKRTLLGRSSVEDVSSPPPGVYCTCCKPMVDLRQHPSVHALQCSTRIASTSSHGSRRLKYPQYPFLSVLSRKSLSRAGKKK